MKGVTVHTSFRRHKGANKRHQWRHIMSHAPRLWPTKKEPTEPKRQEYTNNNDRTDAPLRIVSCSFQICNRWNRLRVDADRHVQRPMSSEAPRKQTSVEFHTTNPKEPESLRHQVSEPSFERYLLLLTHQVLIATCFSKRKLSTTTESSLRTQWRPQSTATANTIAQKSTLRLRIQGTYRKKCEQAK